MVPTEVPAPNEYAGLITRTIALALDALLIDVAALAVAGAVVVVLSVFSISDHGHAVLLVLGSVAFAIWVIAYFTVLWTTTGQTVGSRVMQIQVMALDGTTLRPRRALVRLVGMVISLPLFWGYLPVLTSVRRRGVFDVMAGTVVINVLAVPVTDHRNGRPAGPATVGSAGSLQRPSSPDLDQIGARPSHLRPPDAP